MSDLISCLELLLDPQCGLIKHVEFEQRVLRVSPFYHCMAFASNTAAFSAQTNFQFGKGVAVSKEKALCKAVGEALERYGSAIYDKSTLPLCAQSEASFATMPLDTLCSEKKINPQARLRWLAGTSLQTAEEIYLPASLVYLPYHVDQDEQRLRQNISTGLAFHSSKNKAILSAVCEVLERDAFVSCWQQRLSPKKINLATLPKKLKALVEQFQLRNYSISLFSLEAAHGLPVILASMQAACGFPKLALAASCSVNAESAVLSALEELELVRHNIQLLAGQGGLATAQTLRPEQVKTQKDHIVYWQNAENLPQIEFLYAATEFVDFTELNTFVPSSDDEAVTYLKQAMKKAKMDCYLADITPSDLQYCGCFVLRAIVPQAKPLRFGVDPSVDALPHPFP